MSADLVRRICEEKGLHFRPVATGYQTKGKVYLDTLTEIVNACISADQDDEPFSGRSTDET